MALVLDTGPLYAMLDRSDADHGRCRELILGVVEPLVIPSPVLVEVDYWVNRRLHPALMVALLDDIIARAFVLEHLTDNDTRRVRDLCDQYHAADIGFVDAAVLAVVERLREPKLATLDQRHFGLLRPSHIDALRLVPE